jgi:predicted transcriptional regulator
MTGSDLLLTLLEKSQMTFQEIVNGFIANRNTAREKLDAFIETGLIKTEPKDWQIGQKKYFSLTRKGKIACFRKVEDALKIANFVIETMKKKGFEEYRNRMRQISPTITVRGKEFPVAEDGLHESEEIRQAFKKFNAAFVELYVLLNTFET